MALGLSLECQTVSFVLCCNAKSHEGLAALQGTHALVSMPAISMRDSNRLWQPACHQESLLVPPVQGRMSIWAVRWLRMVSDKLRQTSAGEENMM